MSTEAPLIMPRLYFYRGSNNSDRASIEALMSYVPDEYKDFVCKEYEKCYMATIPRNRKGANDYLESVAAQYKGSL